jgi:hypothetical protein
MAHMGQSWGHNEQSYRREAGTGIDSDLEKPVVHGTDSESCSDDGVTGMKNR